MSEPGFSRPIDQRLNVIVFGRVQGVGFRFFVLQQAVALGLSGWVRNLADGMVEVLAEGDSVSLQELLAALHEGPDAAWVVNSFSDNLLRDTHGIFCLTFFQVL